MKFKVGDLFLVDDDEAGVIVSIDFSGYFCYEVEIASKRYWCIEASLKSPE